MSKSLYNMKIKIIIITVLISLKSYGQVSVDGSGNNANPSYLIDNILIGSGVISSNHNYIGDPSQIGYFQDLNGLIGMDSGFVLTTGRIDSIGELGVDTMPWWNYIYDSTWNIIDSTPVLQSCFLSSSFFAPGDPDLLTIANSVPAMIGQNFTVTSTADAVILEFDFVPSSDTATFNYVFASEEYLDFVNSPYNDVFSFLISGPGISGPYAAPSSFPNGAMNIAVIPNSTPPLPITISTVNDTINSQYYNHDSLATVSAFNGYTDVFTATVPVIACEKYHIKLALADGTDDSYDSGVFFEAGSFNAIEAGPPNLIISTSDVLCNGDSTGIAEACIQGGVGPYTINWNGEDPNSLSAGTYNASVLDASGNTSTTNYTILEPSLIAQQISYNGSMLSTNVTGGVPNYSYQWIFNNITIDTSNSFNPTQTGIYTCIITDQNGCVNQSDPFNVTNTLISQIKHGNEIKIYPNPFNNKTNIKLINSNEKIINISLFDINSNKIRDLVIEKEQNDITLEKGTLSKGLYIIRIQTSKNIYTRKITIK